MDAIKCFVFHWKKVLWAVDSQTWISLWPKIYFYPVSNPSLLFIDQEICPFQCLAISTAIQNWALSILVFSQWTMGRKIWLLIDYMDNYLCNHPLQIINGFQILLMVTTNSWMCETPCGPKEVLREHMFTRNIDY